MRTLLILAAALLLPLAAHCQISYSDDMTQKSMAKPLHEIGNIQAGGWLDVTQKTLNTVDIANVSPNRICGAIPGITLQVKNTSAHSANAVKVVVWYDIDVRKGRMFTTARRSMETIVFGSFAPNTVSNIEYGYFLWSLPLSARIVESGVSGVYQKVSTEARL